MLKILWTLTIGFSIGLAAQAEQMSFKEQTQLSTFFSDALNKLPNEAGFAKILPSLSKKDQAAMQKIIHSWSTKKFGFQVASRLNMVTFDKAGELYLTLETASVSPTTIVINGLHTITVDPKDVYGSVTKQLNNKQASFFSTGFLPEADAATYSTAEMSGLTNAVLMYAGTAVKKEYRGQQSTDYSSIGSAPPWKMINPNNRYGEVFRDWAISSITGWERNPDLSTFVCGKDSVTGHVQTLFDQKFPYLSIKKFKQDKNGLLLGDRFLVNLKPVGESKVEVELDIQICDKGKCQPADLRAMLAAVSEPKKIESYKSLIQTNQERIAEIEEAFRKRHGLDSRLGLNYNSSTATFDLYKVPSAEISADKLKAYREELRPFYSKIRDSEQSIEKLQMGNSKDKKDGEIAAARELFHTVAFARAMNAGCKDNNFLAEAADNDFTIEREKAEGTK